MRARSRTRNNPNAPGPRQGRVPLSHASVWPEPSFGPAFFTRPAAGSHSSDRRLRSASRSAIDIALLKAFWVHACAMFRRTKIDHGSSMRSKEFCVSVLVVFSFFLGGGSAMAGPGGTAVVRVVTTPAYRDAVLRFAGTPAGDVRLDENGIATITAQVDGGQHPSTLTSIDPALVSAGYLLADVSCDDPGSARRSFGDVQNSRATFEVDDAEVVTCTFSLRPSLACKCPKEGRWNIANYTGSMVCTGAMSMTLPLAADRSKGTLEVNNLCDTIVGRGMSADEADVTMILQPDCSWKGEFGGQQDGLPTTINFHWNVESATRITGNLDSTISQQGMTCRMARTFQLDFES